MKSPFTLRQADKINTNVAFVFKYKKIQVGHLVENSCQKKNYKVSALL